MGWDANGNGWAGTSQQGLSLIKNNWKKHFLADSLIANEKRRCGRFISSWGGATWFMGLRLNGKVNIRCPPFCVHRDIGLKAVSVMFRCCLPVGKVVTRPPTHQSTSRPLHQPLGFPVSLGHWAPHKWVIDELFCAVTWLGGNKCSPRNFISPVSSMLQNKSMGISKNENKQTGPAATYLFLCTHTHKPKCSLFTFFGTTFGAKLPALLCLFCRDKLR